MRDLFWKFDVVLCITYGGMESSGILKTNKQIQQNENKKNNNQVYEWQH